MCSMGIEDTLYKNPESISIDHPSIGNICSPQICMLRKMEILRNLAIQEKKSGIPEGMNARSHHAQWTTSGNINKRWINNFKIIFSSLYIRSQMSAYAGFRNFYQDIFQRKFYEKSRPRKKNVASWRSWNSNLITNNEQPQVTLRNVETLFLKTLFLPSISFLKCLHIPDIQNFYLSISFVKFPFWKMSW